MQARAQAQPKRAGDAYILKNQATGDMLLIGKVLTETVVKI